MSYEKDEQLMRIMMLGGSLPASHHAQPPKVVTDQDQLAKWLDPTPLTLEVLTKMLGPPHGKTMGGCWAWGGTDTARIVFYEQSGVVEITRTEANTLGQLRRVLGIPQERQA